MAPKPSAIDTFRRVAAESGLPWAVTLVLDRFLPISPLRLWRPKVVAVEQLTRQIEGILSAWGMSPEQVAPTAELIVYADLHGIDSHGCGMMPGYQRDRIAGVLEMRPDIAVVHETDSTALVDGGGGLGHVPGKTAMELAISKCRKTGIAAVAVRNSGHFGAAGAYAELAPAQGLIGIATTNTRGPVVVPTGAAEPILGTNPIAFAAPGDRNPPFLLDMATSTVPIGRIIAAWKEGRPIPRGWAMGPGRRLTRSARRAALARRVTPLGGSPTMSSHKGYGLAAMVEVLTSVLPGVRFPRLKGDPPGQVGHFFAAIDPARFLPLAEFQSGMDGLMDALHATPPIDPDRPVRVPGDPEREAREARSVSGIPLSRAVYEDLRSVSAASNAAFLLDDPS